VTALLAASGAEAAEPGGLFVAAAALTGTVVLAWLVAAERRGRSPLPEGSAVFWPERPGVLLAGALAVFLAYNLAGALIVQGGGGVGAAAGFAIVGAVIVSWATGRFPHAMIARCRRARLVGLGLLVVWAALPVVLGSLMLIQSLTTTAPQSFVEQVASRRDGWIRIVLLAVLVAPVMEELALRGLLYPALRRWWGPRGAMVATSILFGLMHVEPPSVWGPLAILGAFFCWTVERTGSVLPAVAGHVAFNGLSVLELLTA